MRNIIVGLSTLVSTSVPLASAARTASSISRCDVTPTTLRYLRISMLSQSSFMASSVNLPANDNVRRVLRLKHGKGSQHDPLNLIQRGLHSADRGAVPCRG